MYYNDYEDYMRNVLGYSNMRDNTYSYFNRDTSTSNIEQMYPEIYKIINPMVCRACDNNTQPISEYMVEQMTDDIYDNVVNRVEIQNVINLNIGTTRDDDMEVVLNREEDNSRNGSVNNNTQQNRSGASFSNNALNNSSQNNSLSKTSNNAIASKVTESEVRETRSPRRRNTLLRDLIRILILNRLIRPGRPNRPPYRPGPGGPMGPRPGFPGMPPRPPMPRVEDEYMSNEYYPYM